MDLIELFDVMVYNQLSTDFIISLKFFLFLMW